jgi:tRNA threonylcarbamoyladenosine biosynthesis protein TsaB
MNILCLETATTMCSVGVAINGEKRSLFEINEGYSHAEKIEELVDLALAEAQISLHQLDAVAVGKGPGSYTGLRIGVSLAKGLCLGLNIPLISVNTLEAMCRHPKLADVNGLMIPMLDARRMEVYTAGFDRTLQEVLPTQALVIDETSYGDVSDTEICYFGPVMEKCKTTLNHFTNASFVDEVRPSAVGMMPIAFNKLQHNQIEDVAYFEPFYLKDFVAGKPKKML